MGFPRIQTPDRNLQLIQDNISNALTPLQAMPMVGGNVLTSVALNSGANTVNHGLNHTPKFFILLNIDSNETIWQSAPSTSTTMTISASGACTISLWVN